MPRPRRIMITPDADGFATLGFDASTDGAQAVEAALGRYARHLAAAARETAKILKREEWLFLADCTNGTLWDASHLSMTQVLDAATHAALVDGLGEKWFGDSAPRAVKVLLAKLAKLTEIQADAVAAALRWFWAHGDDEAMTASNPWWTPAFRARAKADACMSRFL